MLTARIRATFVLTAFFCGVGVAAYPVARNADAAPVRRPRTEDDKGDRMFPDGTSHDFGSVPRGTLAKHTFRIVNTSGAPIRIDALSRSMNSLSAYCMKTEIQPGETAEIETTVDTGRFVGVRTQAFFVLMKVGDRPVETRFWIKARSEDNSRP